jgi:hypothetical protein
MPETLTEKQIIKATDTTKSQLHRLLKLGVITAEPFTIFDMCYDHDTIKIIQSMETDRDKAK